MHVTPAVRRIVGIGLMAAATLLLSAGCGRRTPPPPEPPLPRAPKPRIVSLAPATTETLFALGLDAHVIGVSRFCDYPTEVAQLPRVGGLTDVDIEAILRLRPDIVVAPRPQVRARETLAKLGVEVLTVDQDTLSQILDSVWVVGEALDRADVATAWLVEMEALLTAIRARAPQGDARPSVLVSVGRDLHSFERVYIAGKGSFYADILEAVGGRNAYPGDTPYPMVSGEGIVRMDPDIVIDIVTASDAAPETVAERALAQWRTLPGVRAAATDRVTIVTETWAVRPGPRIGFLLVRFAEIVGRAASPAASPAAAHGDGG